MSAGRDLDVFGDKDRETTKRCAVVSIYEDLGGRDLLVQLCHSLARKFKDDLEFQFDWWRFKYLADPEIAMEAAQSAAQADLILLAAQSPELPVEVQTWFEGWLPNRGAGDGALVLVQPSRKGASQSLPLRSFLRRTARRGRLDYLRLSSPGSAAGVAGTGAEHSLIQPDLIELLADDNPPLHWGINE
jgi:hypothetical protein